MFNYEEMKKTLHAALLSGKIDINFYHLMCNRIEELKAKAQVSTHTYTDLNKVYVPSMK